MSKKVKKGTFVKKKTEPRTKPCNLIHQKRQLDNQHFELKAKAERIERELKEKKYVIYSSYRMNWNKKNILKWILCHKLSEKVAGLEQMLNNLKITNKDLVGEHDYWRNLIEENELLELYDEAANKFTNETVECVINLQNFNVSASNIGPVIRTICSLCKREPNKVPSYISQPN